MPVLVWNAAHGWVSFAFQGGRAAGMRLRPFAPLVTLAGEALFVLPWIWLPMMAVFVAALRRGPGAWRSWLLCCLAAPPIVAFAAVSAWSSQRVLFHWAAPGYLMLFPLLGEAVARRWLGRPCGACCSARPRSWCSPRRSSRRRCGSTGCNRSSPRRAQGSRHRRHRLDLAADELAARNLLRPGTIVGVPNWRDAGKIAYALGPEVTVLCLNRDARQFGLAWPPRASRRRYADPGSRTMPSASSRSSGSSFASFERLPDAAILHAGRMLRKVAVFHARRPARLAAPE